eukprot:gene7620-biopygen6466
MTDAIRPLIAGNWKMNGLRSSMAEFEAMLNGASDVQGQADLLICPPATLIATFAALADGSPIAVGGQDCHPKVSGAHTGDVSAEMLADAGASMVIVGHSERRADHGETDAVVRAKADAHLFETRRGKRHDIGQMPRTRRRPAAALAQEALDHPVFQ